MNKLPFQEEVDINGKKPPIYPPVKKKPNEVDLSVRSTATRCEEIVMCDNKCRVIKNRDWNAAHNMLNLLKLLPNRPDSFTPKKQTS
jgi:hypothetical protein